MGEPPLFRLEHGERPLIVSAPHVGLALPPGMAERLSDAARRLPDTDFGVTELYRDALPAGVSFLRAEFSRYVIDLNRAPDGAALYPGRFETGLVPLFTFAGEPVWRTGMEPDAEEVAQRRERYWRPYHDALRGEIDRLRQRHRRVLVWEAHSIRGRLPRLFEGELPDLNLGTADGESCGPDLETALRAELGQQREFSHVVNGRFKGGWITRHYGRPAVGVEAVQLELRQGCFLDEDDPRYDPPRAAPLAELLRRLLARALAVVEESR
ncbi:MAG: N-formylglutamate deformylase [Xanthomonadales bacterium]|nr:N-formylglutamate deformylase [Xanthomonadales bacterium]